VPGFLLKAGMTVAGIIIVLRKRGDGEIAAASFLKEGWTRKDTLFTVSLRGAQRRSNLRVIVGTNGDGEIAASFCGRTRNDIK